jgi:predicted ATPase
MGKTSLLHGAAAKSAEMQIPSVSIQCRPALDPLDLQPLEDLLAKLSQAPEADQLLDEPAADPEPTPTEKPDARELARRLGTELIRISGTNPLLLMLEDLHLASPLARNLARKMGAMLGSLPVVLLLAEEPSPDGAAPPMEGPLELLELPPLEEEDVAELATHLREGRPLAPETLPLIAASSRGNPLHLAELLRALETLPSEQPLPEQLASLPSTLPELLLWRLERLEPELRATLQMAASLDLPAPLEALREIHPDSEALSEQLSRLTASGFPLALSGASTVLIDFAEPLHRELLLSIGLPPIKRP